MVQIIPGAGEQIAPAIAAFSQGLEKYLKPNAEFQKAMQKAVGGNPELAQQLADLEKNAPGTLERMGFGDMGHVIAGIPESAASQFQRKNRGEIIQTQEEQLKLKKNQTGFDLGRLNDTINFLKDPANKAINADEILKRLTGQTATERKIQGAEAGVAERKAAATARSAEAGATSAEAAATAAPAQAQAAIAEAGATVAQAGVARKAYDAALKSAPNLAQTDFLRTARDFVAGKADGATISALFNTPGAKEALSKAISAVEEERQLALRESIASMHGKTDQKDMLLTREAFARYQATKGAGTLQAWKKILDDPAAVEAARSKKPADLTQDDKDIMHAADAQDQMQDNQKLLEVKQLNVGIAESLSKLQTAAKQGAGAEVMNTYLNNLNSVLAQKGQSTGQTYMARYGARPEVGSSDKSFLGTWGEGSGLYYVDATGKRVDESKILADPMTGNEAVRADALRAFATLQGIKDPKQKQVEMDKMKQLRPDIYKMVDSFLKVGVR